MRRQQRWDEALHHFHRARQIEPGYCEPSYWIGITLAAQGRNIAAAIQVVFYRHSSKGPSASANDNLPTAQERQRGLQCKLASYEAIECS